MLGLGLGLGLATWVGCAEDSSGDASACGSDDDCKGARVCEQGECVDPGASAGEGGGSSSGVGPTGGSGGAANPAECLTEVKCANQLDCQAGHHCNTALEVPHCQELYCGAAGTTCSSTELCQTGLLCIDDACTVAPACDNCCDGGQSCYGYASDALFSYPSNPSCLDWESLPAWAAARDCLCSACASECQSWCTTGQHQQDPYYCMDCLDMSVSVGSCTEEMATCNGS